MHGATHRGHAFPSGEGIATVRGPVIEALPTSLRDGSAGRLHARVLSTPASALLSAGTEHLVPSDWRTG